MVRATEGERGVSTPPLPHLTGEKEYAPFRTKAKMELLTPVSQFICALVVLNAGIMSFNSRSSLLRLLGIHQFGFYHLLSGLVLIACSCFAFFNSVQWFLLWLKQRKENTDE